jgi:hypothetical protein
VRPCLRKKERNKKEGSEKGEKERREGVRKETKHFGAWGL